MLNVYLLRHGETSMNADGNRYCGRTDVALTEKGIAQAHLVGHQLSETNLDAVYSSPLVRASHTAEIACGGLKVVRDERLIEIDFGTWEGKTREEFIAENPRSWEQWNLDPTDIKAGETGETALEVVQRVHSFFEEKQRMHPNGTILVVGHNGLNRLFLSSKLGMELRNYRRLVQENSSVTYFSLDENHEIVLRLLNSRC